MDSAAPIKKGRVKANSNLGLIQKIISAIQKRDKLYSRYKKSGLESDADKFETSKVFLQRCYAERKALTLMKN